MLTWADVARVHVGDARADRSARRSRHPARPSGSPPSLDALRPAHHARLLGIRPARPQPQLALPRPRAARRACVWTIHRGAPTVADGVLAEHGGARMTREGAVLVMVLVSRCSSALHRCGAGGAADGATRVCRRRSATARAGAEVLATLEGLYVATTAHDRPLDRLEHPPPRLPLAGTVTVTSAGVALDMPGAPRCSSRRTASSPSAGPPSPSIASSSRGGLPFLAWRTDDLTPSSTPTSDPQDASAARCSPTPSATPSPPTQTGKES